MPGERGQCWFVVQLDFQFGELTYGHILSRQIPRGAAVEEIADKLHDQMREMYDILLKAPSSGLLQMGSAGLLYSARVLQGSR
jgi:hypothetical protein